MTEWLLTGGVDFDYVNEGDMALGDVCASDRLRVGEMTYDTLLIPSCITLRESTLALLDTFVKNGGRVVVVGDLPTYVEARPDSRPSELLAGCERVPFDRIRVLRALEGEKLFALDVCAGARDGGFGNQFVRGLAYDGCVYQYRRDTDRDWLFLAHARKYGSRDCPSRNTDYLKLTLHGHYRVELYDTMTGEVRPYPTSHEGDDTLLWLTFGMSDSLLFALYPSEDQMVIAYCNEKPWRDAE